MFFLVMTSSYLENNQLLVLIIDFITIEPSKTEQIGAKSKKLGSKDS